MTDTTNQNNIIMNTKPFVVIRRNGYYINALPNEKALIRRWNRINLPPEMADQLKDWPDTASSRRAASSFGFTYTPVSSKGLGNVKTFVRR